MNDSKISKLIHFENAEHELYISGLIKKINYNKHFLIVEESCTLPNKFKILYYPYKEIIPHSLSFNTIYHSLLTSVQILIHTKIVHFDINKKNIIHSDNIYLTNFGIAIDMTNVYSKFKKYFYTYFIQQYQWPLEVHLLCYQINVGKITYDILTIICTEFVKHHIILQKSNLKFVKEYISKSIEYYLPIIQLPHDEFIKTCISSWKTWDNYALIIYLFEQYTIPTLFLKNIHYLPTERLSVSKCLELTAASTA
jgi:hypothetical protein